MLWLERGTAGGHVERCGDRAVAAAGAARPAGQAPRDHLHDARRDDADPALQAGAGELAGDARRRLLGCRGGRGGRVRFRARPVPTGRAGAAPRRLRRRVGRLQPLRRRPGAGAAAHVPRRRPALDRPRGAQAHGVPLRRRAVLERRLGNALLEQAHRPRLLPRPEGARPAAPGLGRDPARRDGVRSAVGSARGQVRGRIDLVRARRRPRRTNRTAGPDPGRARALEAGPPAAGHSHA